MKTVPDVRFERIYGRKLDPGKIGKNNAIFAIKKSVSEMVKGIVIKNDVISKNKKRRKNKKKEKN